jgi:uncharacterized protein YoxC
VTKEATLLLHDDWETTYDLDMRSLQIDTTYDVVADGGKRVQCIKIALTAIGTKVK